VLTRERIRAPLRQRLKYISIEGPMPYGGAFDTTDVCEGV
jgi:hypothetical protein